MKNTTKFLSILLLFLLLFSFCLPVAADEEDEEMSFMLDDCDKVSFQGWDKSRPFQRDSSDSTEGAASTKLKIPRGDGAFVIGATYKPLDASGANHLVMDLYVSDPDLWYSSTSTTLEMTSSGKCDVEETSWELLAFDVKAGWNRLELPISPNGGCRLNRINYIRIFTLSIDVQNGLTIGFDNIHLAYIDREASRPTFDTGAYDLDRAIPAKYTTPGTEPVPETEPTADTGDREPTGKQGDNIAAIALLCAGGAVVLMALIAFLVKKDRRMGLILLIVGALVCLIGFLLMALNPSSPASPAETAAPGTEGQTAPVTDAETEPAVTPTGFPWSAGDQTNHPEVSAKTVDVEALLTKNASYDVKPDYRSFYKSVGEAVKQPDAKTGLIVSKYPVSSYTVADVNVLAYGATPDDLFDDTKAIRDAITAASKLGGGTVFLPAGYYCISEPLNVPAGVALIGELEKGTANGTVLCVYCGKGKTDTAKSAVRLEHHTAVKNLAFWYPEQTIVNGSAIPYPASVVQTLSEGVTVENVTFVNSYQGIHFAAGSNNSLQYVRDVYGTCLAIGYENNMSLDIGRVENVRFAADYWLASGLPGTPNEELLRTYLLRNATGMLLERIDWTFYADVTVEGYAIGVHGKGSSDGTANGHMYNFNLLDCYYCLKADQMSWMLLTNCVLRASGGEGATAVWVHKDCGAPLSFNGCTIESKGKNAVVNNGTAPLSFTDCKLTSSDGRTVANYNEKEISFVNCTVSDGMETVITDETMPMNSDIPDYGKEVITKPASDKFIDLTKAPYNAKKNGDITEALKQALNDLKATGGTVYLPAGYYYVSDHVDVWAGIELRGAADFECNLTGVTRIQSSFGENDPDGPALFDLYDGAGMRGIAIYYPNQDKGTLKPYSFTIRGHGKNVYLVDMTLPTSWNGVDFATYRCDNHYVEYIHAAIINTGITVGAGSENGIIRDCQFTPNTWVLRSKPSNGWWGDVYNILMKQGCTFVVGESKNEILYHNFTYGAYEGLSIRNGAENVFVLAHGVDAGNYPVRVSGNSTSLLIDCQLVNLNGADNRYFLTDEDFTGTVTTVNQAGWGSTKGAFLLKGTGTVNVIGGQMHAAGSPMCEFRAGTANFYGLFNAGRSIDFKLGGNASSLRIAGNIMRSGLRITGEENGCKITGSDAKEE